MDPEDDFLKSWFSGFIFGLEQLDESSRDIILRSCGEACAESYTLQVFQEEYQNSVSLEDFLNKLADRFPGVSYKLINQDTIEVIYSECACDLVRRGWIKSPLLCGCSVRNLQINFEKSLNKAVKVYLKSSILDGTEACRLLVELSEV
jgi:hypothetical protein